MTTAEIFKTPIFLAPMAGVTDTAFRVLVRELLDGNVTLHPDSAPQCSDKFSVPTAPKPVANDFVKKNLLMFSEMVSAGNVTLHPDSAPQCSDKFGVPTAPKPVANDFARKNLLMFSEMVSAAGGNVTLHPYSAPQCSDKFSVPTAPKPAANDFARKNLLMFSEMVSAAGVHYCNEKTLAMLQTVAAERPAAIQIFGSDPKICAEAAAYVEELGSAAVIDFNAGCPAPKIVKNGEGSALMKNPALLEGILFAVKKAVSLPVSVKIRLGYDAAHINAVEVAKRAEAAGVDFITVHGRTREQFYSGSADWEAIAKVKAAVKIPVIANGDVRDFDSLDKILATTQADGVMIGRAAQGNPWIINRLLNYFLTGEKLPPPTVDERADVMRRHLAKIIFYKGERVGVREMRAHAAWYTKGLAGGAELRNAFNHAETADDFLKIIDMMKVVTHNA